MQSVFSSNTPLSNTGSPNNTFIRGYDGDVEEIAQLRNTYDELLAVLQKSNLKDRVAEVFNLMHDVLEAKEMLITVENYRKSKPGWDIKGISFSNLTSADYTRLNVKIRKPVPAETFDIAANSAIGLPRWDFTDLDKGVSRIGDCVNLQHEAGCRMLIDQHIYCLIDHCEATHAFYCIPELQISRMAEDAFPIAIERPLVQQATLLSGSADYALFLIPEDEYFADIHDGMQDLKKVQDRKRLFMIVGGRFVVLEAKGTISSDLGKFMPQVVGQCLAIWKLVPTAPRVPFCLTSGTAWIFGIMDCSASGSVCWRSEEIAMTRNDFNRIMNPLYLWAKHSGEDILNLFINMENTPEELATQ